MKSLKPTMREDKRYLLVKGKNLRENVERAVAKFGGSSGLAKACLGFIEVQGDSAIVAVNRDAVNFVRASLLIFPEKMEVLRVSGTIKGVRGNSPKSL